MTDPSATKRSLPPTLRFVIVATVVLGVMGGIGYTLLYAVGHTSDPNYLRKGKVETKPTVNIRGQLD